MLRAKKSLGQNFLNSSTIARDIVRAANLSEKDTVIEIGPGKGFLTTELLATGAHVIAIEKDDRMIPLLSEKFTEEIKQKKFTIVHGDVIEEIEKKSFTLPVNYKLVANIPYYITGQIIRTFLESNHKPTQMVLMVQKEVATRIVARDKKESILSLSVKAYGIPKLIKKVPARYFTPAPKVDSAVLSIENISGKNFQTKEYERTFFELIHAGFAHKRKVLAGNLRELFGDNVIEELTNAGLTEKTRAEDVPLLAWLNLAEKYNQFILKQ